MRVVGVSLHGLRASVRKPDTRFWRCIKPLCQPRQVSLSTQAVQETPVADQIPHATVRSDTSFLRPRPNAIPASKDGHTDVPEDMVERIRIQLGRAIESSDLRKADALFVRWSHILKTDNSVPEASIRGTCEQFMYAYFRLRNERMALQAWNLMVAHGCKPTVSSWSIMIKGCHWDRNPKRMELLWSRMRASGIQPDVHAWTTRIFGLFRNHRPMDGMRALQAMSDEWREARKPKQQVTEPAEPTTAVLNCAISGLSNTSPEWIPRVLTWAESLKINPDISTYNTLLQVALAANNEPQVRKILSQINNRGMEPDSSTSTIMLNDMFRVDSFSSMSSDQQTSTVMALIQSLETERIPVSDKGYAIIIDRLLKHFGNTSAAHKVLAYMNEQIDGSPRATLTPPIYTILMTHYFELEPPNLAAADALWRQIKATPNWRQDVDVIFYDRMIAGHAKHGDADQMMAFLTRMSREGKRPGWLALMAVVQRLASMSEWDRIRGLARDASGQTGMLRAGIRGTKGQADFWALVARLDLDRQ